MLLTLSESETLNALLRELNYPDIARISNEISEHISASTTTYTQIITRLKQHEPWEYIRGWAEFCGSRFNVTPATLIPRLETETLVERGIEIAKDMLKVSKELQIVDIGTGSGAIIISVAKGLSTANGINYIATDISESALTVARENAQLNLVNNVDFLNSNLIESDKINFNAPTLLLANLPYLGEAEFDTLDLSVKLYEPKSALVAGVTGHELYLQLLDACENFSVPPRQLWEISSFIIQPLTTELVKRKIPHNVVRDQFDTDRFIEL